MNYAPIQIRPRAAAFPALRDRGAWRNRKWRTIAHAQDDTAAIDRTMREMTQIAPGALYEYRIGPRANPPAHLHIPRTVAQLGTVLDLTTRTDHILTTWEMDDVGRMIMACDPDAMDRPPGSAALYLLRPPSAKNPPIDPVYDRDVRAWINAHGIEEGIARAAEYAAEEIPQGLSPSQTARQREITAWFKELHRKLLEQRDHPSATPRKRNHDQYAPPADQKDAARTYEQWHERRPSRTTELDGLPDLIGVYIGRAMRIGYASDKWHEAGKVIDYDHDYTEPGYEPPEVWADRLDLSHARAIAIVGGNQRITADGID